jgi:hypothetical protein
MSYNITSVKRIKIDELYLKLSSIYDEKFGDWMPEKGEYDPKTDKMTISCGCEQEITGQIVGNEFKVSEMYLSGEGSGTFWRDVMATILKTSRGKFSATFIWEGGDSVERITVEDGVITVKEVDL